MIRVTAQYMNDELQNTGFPKEIHGENTTLCLVATGRITPSDRRDYDKSAAKMTA